MSDRTDRLPELREALAAGDGGMAGERLNAWAISEIEDLRAQIAAIRKWVANHEGAWWLAIQIEQAMKDAHDAD